MQSFTAWLAELLEQSEFEVQRLLSDETAMHFLLAWSLFEAKCFKGDLGAQDLKAFAGDVGGLEEASFELLASAGKHFHERYQDRTKLSNPICCQC